MTDPSTHYHRASRTLARCQHGHLFNTTVNDHCPTCRHGTEATT